MSNMERDLSRSAAFPMLMRKVYIWMTMALVITGLCAWGVATSPSLVQLVYGNRAAMWVLLLAELGLVFYTTARINRLSLSTATTLFIVYAALNGVTMFIKSTSLDLVLSYIGVVLFVGLTAWDSQQIKRMLSMQVGLDEGAQKVALIGALSLYLDFINLFLYLLRIFGRNDN